MQATLDLCVYCERSSQELVDLGLSDSRDEALEWTKVGDYRILLCLACIYRFTDRLTQEQASFLEGPIIFPPGTEKIEHVCPELMYDGVPEEQAALTIEFIAEPDGFLTGQCPFCGLVVKSRPADGIPPGREAH